MKNPFLNGWFQRGSVGEESREDGEGKKQPTGRIAASTTDANKQLRSYSNEPTRAPPPRPPATTTPVILQAILPRAALGLTLRVILGATVALYVLNQKHMLPRPLSAVVSKTLFWPTLPITASKRWGSKWMTQIDDTIIVGGLPLGFLGYPERLYDEYGVRGVINFCEEYKGPVEKYKQLGMQHLHLPTTDHFEPSLMDLVVALSFIRAHEAKGDKVYIHCRAGHGRSAAGAFAWLMYKNPKADLQQLNQELCKKRNVRKTLWKQENIQELHIRLKRGKVNDKTNIVADSSPPPTVIADSERDDSDSETSSNEL